MTDNLINKTHLKTVVKQAMRKATPKDTGNLAYRALHGHITKTGLKLVYRGYIAGYGRIIHVSNEIQGRKNKHKGWHNRANSNAILSVRELLGDRNIRRGSKYYDTKQIARYNPDIPGSGRAMFAQQEKWYTNSARIRFETMNKV